MIINTIFKELGKWKVKRNENVVFLFKITVSHISIGADPLTVHDTNCIVQMWKGLGESGGLLLIFYFFFSQITGLCVKRFWRILENIIFPLFWKMSLLYIAYFLLLSCNTFHAALWKILMVWQFILDDYLVGDLHFFSSTIPLFK